MENKQRHPSGAHLGQKETEKENNKGTQLVLINLLVGMQGANQMQPTPCSMR